MTVALGFQDWMKDVQSTMEDALASFLPPSSHIPSRLHEAMRYAALDGGKRVRPLLVFAAGEVFDADPAVLARAGAAVEMIHAYSLVHDDMPCMDDDALRRGKPTVHVKYDEATALLVGDALQSQAFIVLSEGETVDAARRLDMLRLLARASGSVGMCGGQAIDLDSVGLSLSLGELENMHRLKTGALLRASVLLGALAGKRLAPEETESLDAYSAAIGLAFQVVDDVLDATADSATLGKTAGKDAANDKPTYVSLMGLDGSRAYAGALLEQALEALSDSALDDTRALQALARMVVNRDN
jgi:farnesyl diphosphate synthase